MANKERLIGSFNFYIADDKQGFTYLDEPSIRAIIKHFKKSQSDCHSPAHLIIWLMTSPFPFDKSLTLDSIKHGIPISVEFPDIQYVTSKIMIPYFRFFISEIGTTIWLGKARGYYFSIAMDKSSEEELIPILKKVEDTLTTQFREGIKNCSPYIANLSSLSVITEQSSFEKPNFDHYENTDIIKPKDFQIQK